MAGCGVIAVLGESHPNVIIGPTNIMIGREPLTFLLFLSTKLFPSILAAAIFRGNLPHEWLTLMLYLRRGRVRTGKEHPYFPIFFCEDFVSVGLVEGLRVEGGEDDPLDSQLILE